jgi:hypothetical protein
VLSVFCSRIMELSDGQCRPCFFLKPIPACHISLLWSFSALVFNYKISLMGVLHITVFKCVGLKQSLCEDHLEQLSLCIWCPTLLWLRGPCILCSSYLFVSTFNWTLPLFTLLHLVNYYLFLVWWIKNYTIFTLECPACNFLYHVLIHTIYMLCAGLNLI